jgi:hypothetical protein
MPIYCVCTVCGETFAGDVVSAAPVCRKCQTTALSEQPFPAPEPGPTAIQGETPAQPATPFDESLANIRRPASSPGLPFLKAAVLGALALVAFYVFLMLACVGWAERRVPSPDIQFDGVDPKFDGIEK